jgi:hypothetical protein
MASSHVPVLLDIWLSIHIVGGHFLIPVLLVTFLLSKAKRDATLVNLGITLSASSVLNCLLSDLPRPLPFLPLTHMLQGCIHTNTMDLNQISHCVSFKPQVLAHLPPCPSLPILAYPCLNPFAFIRWSVAALTLILQIRSRVELKPVPWLPAVRSSSCLLNPRT